MSGAAPQGTSRQGEEERCLPRKSNRCSAPRRPPPAPRVWFVTPNRVAPCRGIRVTCAHLVQRSARARTRQGGKVCESRVSSLVSRYVALLTFAFVGANRDVMPRCGLGHRRCVSAGEDRIFATRMSRACTQTLLCSDAHTVWQLALRLVHCEAEAPRPSAARLAARRHARPRPLRGPLLAGAPRDAYCIAPPRRGRAGGVLALLLGPFGFSFCRRAPCGA